jgi:hypothetical protein
MDSIKEEGENLCVHTRMHVCVHAHIIHYDQYVSGVDKKDQLLQ